MDKGRREAGPATKEEGMKKLFRNDDPSRYEKTCRESDPLFASWYVTDPDTPSSLHAFGRFEDALAYFLA